MGVYSTGVIEEILYTCDDIETLRQDLLPKLQDQRTAWQEKIGSILKDSGLSCKQFAALCQVSEPAVRKWRNGALPQSRDMYLRVGFAAGFDLEQMNAFLLRYGRCPQLYVKSLEDSACIFVLQSETLPHTYAQYRLLLQQLQQALEGEASEVPYSYGTQRLQEHVASLTDQQEMVDFVRANAASFRQSYGRLYSYILAFLRINASGLLDESLASFHSMAEESGWSSSLRHCISEIRNHRWFPLRQKIISLGLHLNMDVEDINTMLRYAQMERLYPKNPVEAAVIFAVEDAKLNEVIFRDGSDDLCQYVKSVLQKLDLADSEYLINDL